MFEQPVELVLAQKRVVDREKTVFQFCRNQSPSRALTCDINLYGALEKIGFVGPWSYGRAIKDEETCRSLVPEIDYL